MSVPDQLSLLSDNDLQQVRRSRYQNQPDHLTLSATALQDWKQRIAQYQQQVQIHPVIEQVTLFGAASTPLDADTLDPFRLPQQNTEFWRWKAHDQGVAALYFVIDYDLSLLLYVGETVKSNQRWKGEHDCKRYLENYRAAHYQHQLTSTLGIAFWPHAPVATRPRQQLESQLIYKWRSPFNKENWDFWGTPFVGGKS